MVQMLSGFPSDQVNCRDFLLVPVALSRHFDYLLFQLSHFFHSKTHHMGGFCILAIVCNAATNWGMQISLQHTDVISFGYLLRSGMSNSNLFNFFLLHMPSYHPIFIGWYIFNDYIYISTYCSVISYIRFKWLHWSQAINSFIWRGN